MDLVHSSYGGSMSGQIPTRLFLNDGLGFFKEFNPSGFQLAGSAIPAGSPGLWCEGVQTTNTSNTTGTECDIASNPQDIDLGDVDGDFDLDILHGSVSAETRFFDNRLEENGGSPSALGFRDVTHAVFPPNWTTGSGHYEQELGDLDGDNDWDILGVDWLAGGVGFTDALLRNEGGAFSSLGSLPESGGDSNEGDFGDFGDFDNDGDLDIFISSYVGVDVLYENSGSGSYTKLPSGPAGSGLEDSGVFSGAWDADWCDVDGDGDYDIFSAQDSNRPILYWQNQTDIADATPPRVSPTEAIGDQTAGIFGSADFPVRTHVYDNSAYYTTWYNETSLVVEVDGIQVDKLSAVSSGGQVFRATLPSNLVGQVTYRFESADEYGNTGVSSDTSYNATTALTLENTFGTGTAGTTGLVHEIHLRGLATAGKNLYLSIETNSTPTIYIMTLSSGSIAPTPITDLGILNIDPFNILLQRVGVTNASGTHVRKFAISETVPSGFSIYAQIFGLDGTGGDTYSSSRGLEIPFH